MSESTLATQEAKPFTPDNNINSSVSREKPDFEAANLTNGVDQDAGRSTEPAIDAESGTGGLKAWLYVLATFFMFISAW